MRDEQGLTGTAIWLLVVCYTLALVGAIGALAWLLQHALGALLWLLAGG